MRVVICGLLALAGWAPVVLPILDDPIQVRPTVSEGRVSSSFAAPTTFGEDARALLRSGLLVTFTWTVDLRRPSTIWTDQTLATAVVVSSAKLDTLTGVYRVSKGAGDTVTWSDRTSDEMQVRTWVTSFDGVKLEPAEPLQANGEYYVRVRLQTSPRRSFSLWPWGRTDALGRASLTYIR